MKKNLLFVSVISTVLIFISCTKELEIDKIGFEKSFQIAKKKFNDEKFLDALNDLNSIILNYGGENGIDSAQYLIARSHYMLKEYYSASYEFEKLADNFPESPLIEDAYFNTAECYRELSPEYVLDQKETLTAISKYQIYLDLFPKGKYFSSSNNSIKDLREKLARKTFDSGVLYLKLDQPRAAKVYFNEIIDNYYDTSFYIQAVEKISQAYSEMKDEYNYRLYLSKYQELKSKQGDEE
ncbi:MAG TPA: outer membrane protein assembly factor BamD [Clostridiales bacterium]|jgi:outer membrane protein assembly factor BamD|nr:outer membrane protein assembly factor BamD [Clostridiales bacterium]HQP69410.1 outer membrane protein assembly factor BamD [Clostridiales bacterium]